MLDLQWILSVFGLVSIVTFSRIFQPIRIVAHKIHGRLGELISCPMCFAFWAGIIFHAMGYSHTNSWIFDGLLASSTSYIIYGIMTGINSSD